MIEKRVVVTGGPCAGKTTAMAYLYDNLTPRGWRVVIVPEAATIVLNATGRLASQRTPEFFARAQKVILELQRDFAASLAPIVEGEEKVLYLYDRAELDNRAYVGDEVFNDFLALTHGKDAWEVAHSYDAIIHMVTAADGAEQAYTTSNNEARMETVAEAIALDEATKKAWLGHSHYTIIDNKGSFDSKLVRTLTAVLNVLGEPEPIECERKWKLTETPDLSALQAVPVHIVQYYLAPPTTASTEIRLRARTIDKHTTYYKTIKTPTADPSVRIEHENIISAETFNELLTYKSDRSRIEKTRWCFAYEGQHFELDHLNEPYDLWLLEAELLTQGQEVILPAFLGELVEVTDDKNYSNAQIALAGKPVA